MGVGTYVVSTVVILIVIATALYISRYFHKERIRGTLISYLCFYRYRSLSVLVWYFMVVEHLSYWAVAQ